VSTPARRRVPFEEYLRLEEYSNVKHEYLDGVMYAMSGGSPRHAALTSQVIAALVSQLRGRPCAVFTSDLRIRVTATGLATYPDVSVVCGPLETDPADRHAVLNPTLVVEVLSDSTEEYDRTEKLDHYRQIPTLREIALVSQHEPRVEVWRRRDGDWTHDAYGSGSRAPLTAVGCDLGVDELYAGLPDDAR
jgi:Uma2 family endonuclease